MWSISKCIHAFPGQQDIFDSLRGGSSQAEARVWCVQQIAVMHLVPKHVEQAQIALDKVGIVLVRPWLAQWCDAVCRHSHKHALPRQWKNSGSPCGLSAMSHCWGVRFLDEKVRSTGFSDLLSSSTVSKPGADSCWQLQNRNVNDTYSLKIKRCIFIRAMPWWGCCRWCAGETLQHLGTALER